MEISCPILHQGPGAAAIMDGADDMDADYPDGAPAATDHTHPQNAWDLLSSARHYISQGNPSFALHAVVMATRYNGGEAAVHQTLNRALELYRSKLRADAAVDELASLFAECAIEAQHASSDDSNGGGASLMPKLDENSILAESGRGELLLDACQDGSSFICLRCGGLFSNHRGDEHLQFWCNPL